MIFSLSDLEIGYESSSQRRSLVSPFSCSVEPGTLISLLGLNGVGKSTLLKTLAGLQKPLSGSVLVNDKSLHQMSVKERSEIVSVILPFEGVKPNLTVREYVRMGLNRFSNWFGGITGDSENLMNNVIELFALCDLSSRKVFELSDGEFQRVELARCVVQQTPIILLDEPISHLDFPSRELMMQLLRNLTREMNLSFVVSTHEVPLAEKYSDKFWLMNKNGKVDVVDVLKKEKLTELFGIASL